jgi:DNA-binding NarL/FixJ family response regulator
MMVQSLGKMINDSGVACVTRICYDLKSCRAALTEKKPDILLLDIELPDGDGVDFCAEVLKIYPDVKVVMLTGYKQFNIARHALHRGALGYILKNAESEEILACIETVNKGELFLCEEINLLLKDKKDSNVIWLTKREKEVLRRLADGHTTKEIADLLFLDMETVKTYRKNLFVKLNARNVAELIRKAYEMKLA